MLFFDKRKWTKWSRPKATRNHLYLVQTRYCEETGEFQLKHVKSWEGGGNFAATNEYDVNMMIDELMEKNNEPS